MVINPGSSLIVIYKGQKRVSCRNSKLSLGLAILSKTETANTAVILIAPKEF